MKHIHFDEINSTQDYLITNLKDFKNLKDENYLISTSNQTAGRGRGEHIWDNYNNALAFSFTTSLNEVMTLTSLEVSCLLLQFIESKTILKLKWPNDILDSKNKKCAGILVQVIEDKAVVGIGINWGKSEDKNVYKTGKSHIFDVDLTTSDQKSIPLNFYDFFQDNRMSSSAIISYWNDKCAHLNQIVSIIDGDLCYKGKFVGLGKNGEALLDIDNQIIKIYNGSLIID